MSLYPDLQYGEIITLTVDYGDGSEMKIRPALVISQNILRQNSNRLVYLGITTKPYDKYMKAPTNKDLKNGSLDKQSCIIWDKLIWSKQPNIRKRIGRINDICLQDVMKMIKQDVLYQ